MAHEIENIKECLTYMSEKQGLDILRELCSDNRLSDNFETALAALIEHHGADALTSLAAVMRHLDISIELDHDPDMSSVTIKHNKKELYYLERDDSIGFITANDIKPEK